MNRTLGIDLGSNSLGWALLDDLHGDILGKGVLVFPEDKDLEAKSSLDTPAARRRAARMGRRMKFRRKMRKWKLLKLLIDNGMCPLKEEELRLWKEKGIFPLSNEVFINWLKSSDTQNPYCDRKMAAEGKVMPEVLGRALYHIIQRRGFKSSRKDEASGSEGGGNTEADKELGKVKLAIKDLSAEIAETGCKTLGQYFYKVLEDNKKRVVKERVRCRYTSRIEHYLREFNVIMDVQGIDKELREKLRDAIFMQRPLRSQKHLVGKCPLEPNNSRAQISHPAFEEFRMLAFVNNLSFEDSEGLYKDTYGRPLYELTQDERNLVCAAFMRAAPYFKFDVIREKFSSNRQSRYVKQNLHFHYYENSASSIPSCYVRHRIKSVFGEIAYDEQKVFDALTFFDDNEKLHNWFKKHYPQLGDEQIDKLIKIHPKEGYANYSLKAINKILPFLREGYELSKARFLAKLPDLIPDFETHKKDIISDLDRINISLQEEKANVKYPNRTKPIPRLFDLYKDYFQEKWHFSEEDFQKLYIHDGTSYVPEESYKDRGKEIALAQPRIPKVELGMIRNPLVQRAMTTLRRLVNYLAEHGKLDFDDTIRIELARDVNDFATRSAWKNWQEERAKKREDAKKQIKEAGIGATEDAIDRCILWEEQGETCLYTGKSISLAELLQGNVFDIEHTIPRSLSGDDSLANKTICDVKYNRQTKKGQIPRNCPNWDEIDARLRPWRENVNRLEKGYRRQINRAKTITEQAARVKARIKALTTRFELDYWRDKLRRFDITMDKLQAQDGGLGGFKKRQLVDTGIMTKHAVELLKCLYPKTYTVNGTATAFARRAWGIQCDEVKDRSEHTHHAKDAMVIAALTPARFTAICSALKDDGKIDKYRRPSDVCPAPYPGFAEKVRIATSEILIRHILRRTTMKQSSVRNVLAKSHHVKNDPNLPIVSKVLSKGDTVRGQLHKETFYGCIVKPEDGMQYKVVRKPLVGSIKDAKGILDKIVDPKIKEIVSKRIQELEAKGSKNIEINDIKMPSGVPINKVRIVPEKVVNAHILRNHTTPSKHDYKNPYYVTSAEGSNFRMAIYCVKGKYSVKVDNSLVWAKEHKRSDYISLEQMPGFIGYIYPGSMALTFDKSPDELKKLKQYELVYRLYKVVKFTSKGQVTFRYHTEARASVALSSYLLEIGKLKAGESSIDFVHHHELLLLSSKTYCRHMLFEGIHFKMLLDGTIQFLNTK